MGCVAVPVARISEDSAAMRRLTAKTLVHGVEVAPSTPGEFQAFMQVDQRRWSKLMREAKISVESIP